MTPYTAYTSFTATPAVIVASDTVDRAVTVSCPAFTGNSAQIGFSSTTLFAPAANVLQFVLPAGVDLYAATQSGTSYMGILVTGVPAGPSSFSATISGTLS